MNARMTWAIALLSSALLIGLNVLVYLNRTEGMAPVSWPRLIAALAFQGVGVIGITALVQPGNAPMRRFLEDTSSVLPWAMALGGVVLGIGLAVGALHYSNCSRWDFNRGITCNEG